MERDEGAKNTKNPFKIEPVIVTVNNYDSRVHTQCFLGIAAFSIRNTFIDILNEWYDESKIKSFKDNPFEQKYSYLYLFIYFI